MICMSSGQEKSENLFSTISWIIVMQNLQQKDKYIIAGLEQLGFECFVEEYRDLRSQDKKEPKDIKSVRSKAYTSILKVLDKYYDRHSYNINDFKKDIEKFLIRKSRSESFNLPLLRGNLWNN